MSGAPRNTVGGYVATGADALIAVLAIGYVVTSDIRILFAWAVLATLYLAVGGIVLRARSLRGTSVPGRVGALDTLSWIIPLVASVTGLSCAVNALVAAQAHDVASLPDIALSVLGALGVVLAWLLLHTGFANVYEAANTRDRRGIRLPEEPTMDFGDYLYVSFTIGASFATSDAVIETRRMRWIVMVHQIVSFFYNAIVIAIAIGVIQRIAAAVVA